jgi:hypothetical protein
MGVKNVLTSCLADAGNTGFGQCFTDFGMPRGVYFTPKGKNYSLADIATLKAAIEADLLADLPKNRMYPLNNIVNVTDQSEATVYQKFNTGASYRVRYGFYNLTLQWTQGGFCVLYALLKANGQNKPFFIYTDRGLLIGTDAGTTSQPQQFKGINANIADANMFKFSDGTKAAEYTLTLDFEPTQINQSIAFADFSNDGGLAYLNGLNGLQNVTLNQLVAPTSTVIKIGATTACGSVNLHDIFATELAVVGAWKVTNAATGGVIVVSAVANDTADGGWALTLTAATGLTVNVELVGPTELAALLVVGYEGDTLSQIIP